MGMRGARQYVKAYTLEASGSGTRVRTVASVLGDISDETRARYDAGGVEVLERLKRSPRPRAADPARHDPGPSIRSQACAGYWRDCC
jgi:hypothetical protein